MRASVSFRLLGDGRRGATQRRRNRRSASLNFFANVTLVGSRGRCRRANNNGDTADTATSLNFFDAIGSRCARAETATGHITEAALPKTALGRTVSSGKFPPRVVNSTEQITELGQLTQALVRFLRHPWRLLRAGGRSRNSENKGRAARMAWSLNRIATTDLRAA